MDATPSSSEPTEALNPLTSNPRELMQALLPAARREYVRAWEWLADAATPLDKRRIGREKAQSVSADHAIVAAALRDREKTLTGEDLLNARHLADELERHASALERIVSVSPIGLQTADDLRPEALGCGKRYRDPARTTDSGTKTRGVDDKPKAAARGRDDRDRDRTSAAAAKGPKAPKDMLGSSKHDSQLADDMDEVTRAKLEAMKQALEGS